MVVLPGNLVRSDVRPNRVEPARTSGPTIGKIAISAICAMLESWLQDNAMVVAPRLLAKVRAACNIRRSTANRDPDDDVIRGQANALKRRGALFGVVLRSAVDAARSAHSGKTSTRRTLDPAKVSLSQLCAPHTVVGNA
jgi:hypothetical protein